MVTEHIIIKSFQDITNSGIFSNVGGFLKLESHFPKKLVLFSTIKSLYE